ncbi:MAG: amidohydrolase family protein [Kiritimatiellae bacterium]|nr:amidohydrolase family protein [Kiritimatiellia bacterium]
MKKIDIHIHLQKDDPTLESYLAHMDAHEVEAALVHATSREEVGNEAVRKAVSAHPDRLYGSVYVDLRRPVYACIDLIKEYRAHGFKSIKLFPNLGYDPNDEQFEPFWQAVEDLGLMCLSHCGWLAPAPDKRERRSSLTATPFHFEIPARRHPGINFIFAHFGGGATYLETVTLLSRLKNCYADTCRGWGVWVWEQRMPGLKGLDFHHVLFGTDSIGAQYGEHEKWWTQTLLDMGRSEDDLKLYFYENNARLLGLGA